MTRLIQILFLVLFVGGLLNRTFFSSAQRLLCDLVMISIFLFAILKIRLQFCKYFFILFFYLLLVLLSFIINEVPLSDFMFFFPRYYQNQVWLLFIVAIFWKYPFNLKEIQSLSRFLLFMCLLQIPVAVYSILSNQRIEGYVGFMASSGGGLATFFSCTAAAFFFVLGTYGNKKWYWIVLAVPLIGFASNKRGIFYLVPLSIYISVILCYFKTKLHHVQLKRKLIYFLLIVIVSLPIAKVGVENTRFAYSNRITTENSTSIFNFLSEIMIHYLSDSEIRNLSTTDDRKATTQRVWNLCTNDVSSSLFGIHPLDGVVFEIFDDSGNSARLYQYGIGYGLTGVMSDCFSAGLIAAFLVLCFMVLSAIELYRLDTHDWIPAFRYLPLAFSAYGWTGLLVYITYSPNFFISACAIFPYTIFTMVFLSQARRSKNIFVEQPREK